MLVTFAAFCGCGYQVSTVFMQYYKRDVAVSKTFSYQRQVVFPAVTFCNMNPVKRSAISDNAQLSTVASQKSRKRRSKTVNDGNKSEQQVQINKSRAKRASKNKARIDFSVHIIYFNQLYTLTNH